MKVTFFDLESTALTANWGRILCGSFTDLGSEEVKTYRKDVKPHSGRNKVDDGKLAVAIRNELERSDLIIGWNSILFDVPLLNARLDRANERPLHVGEKYGIWHLDLMYYAGGQSMRIGGRKLDTVAKYFEVEAEKTELDGDTWQLAATGDVDAMDSVVEHCEKDVVVLKQVAPHLFPHVKKFQFTLAEIWPYITQIPSRNVR